MIMFEMEMFACNTRRELHTLSSSQLSSWEMRTQVFDWTILTQVARRPVGKPWQSDELCGQGKKTNNWAEYSNNMKYDKIFSEYNNNIKYDTPPQSRAELAQIKQEEVEGIDREDNTDQVCIRHVLYIIEYGWETF